MKEYDKEAGVFIVQGAHHIDGLAQEKRVSPEELLRYNQNVFSSEEFLRKHPHLLSRGEELLLPGGRKGMMLNMHSPGMARFQEGGGEALLVPVEAVIALNRGKLLGNNSYTVVEHKVEGGYEFDSDRRVVRAVRGADNAVEAKVEAVANPRQSIVDIFKLRINDTIVHVTIPHAHVERAEYICQWVGECYSALPDTITSHIPNVVLDPNLNPADPYWRERYNSPNHTSLATAGAGTLTFYLPALNMGGIQSPLKVLHEMGHEIGRVRYGRELAGDEWVAAMKRDNASVSPYGDNSPAEDFAEAFAHFAYSMLSPDGEIFKESPRSRGNDERAVAQFREACQAGRIPVLEEIFLSGPASQSVTRTR